MKKSFLLLAEAGFVALFIWLDVVSLFWLDLFCAIVVITLSLIWVKHKNHV